MLEKFAKFARKRLCRSLVFNKVAGWENSLNSQENIFFGVSFLTKLQTGGENSCGGVLLLIKLHAGEISKFTRKRLCRSLIFNKAAGWENSLNSQENTLFGVSFLIKLQAGRATQHQYAYIFVDLFITKPMLSAPLTQRVLTHNWKVR